MHDILSRRASVLAYLVLPCLVVPADFPSSVGRAADFPGPPVGIAPTWALSAVQPIQPPQVENRSQVRGPLDRFILAALEKRNLRPNRAATRRQLIRRVSFDLTGLPPTAEQVAEFLADPSPGAYERLVDRLLASPRYGERWARHWLDLARYAYDQAHQLGVMPKAAAWRYRDWVVAALNRDLPYDRFLVLQLAADQLQDETAVATAGDWAALGFLALGPVYYKKNDAARAMAEEIDDRVDVVTRTMLGMTVSCARCHDHPHDPIPTADYYSLAGVFASSRQVEIPHGGRGEVRRYYDWRRRMAVAANELQDFLNGERDRLLAGTNPGGAVGRRIDDSQRTQLLLDDSPETVVRLLPPDRKQQYRSLRQRIEAVRSRAPERAPIMHAVVDGQVRDLAILDRGNPRQPLGHVPRRFLQAIAGEVRPPYRRGSGRLELARDITDPGNPLTARVIVNRLWQHHFGRGIVATPSNFGARGARPTHPRLLDYLANRLIESGWSLKAVQREIVLSAAYRRSSDHQADGGAVDPENRLLWRQRRRRLEIEPLRDAMLAVSGQLDGRIGGPGLELTDALHRRRTIYTRISRSRLNQTLELFDFPDPNVHAAVRSHTLGPQQQLYLLNSPWIQERAKQLAARAGAKHSTFKARIGWLYITLFAREPTVEELAIAQKYLSQRGSKDLDTAWQQYAHALLISNESLFVD